MEGWVGFPYHSERSRREKTKHRAFWQAAANCLEILKEGKSELLFLFETQLHISLLQDEILST